MNTMNRSASALLILAVAFGAHSGCASTPPAGNTVALNRQAPEGWALGGRDAATYRVDVDAKETRRDVPSATLLSTQATPSQFALLAQELDATPYRSARIRFSGYLKSVDVLERTFLWARIDSDSVIALAFDDMHLRPVSGTNRWKVYEVLLDVPAEATIIRMGAGLIGTGQIWLNDCLLEIVEEEFASTDRQLQPVAMNAEAEVHFWEEALELQQSDAEPAPMDDKTNGS